MRTGGSQRPPGRTQSRRVEREFGVSEGLVPKSSTPVVNLLLRLGEGPDYSYVEPSPSGAGGGVAGASPDVSLLENGRL
jgi:hypothetical protein